MVHWEPSLETSYYSIFSGLQGFTTLTGKIYCPPSGALKPYPIMASVQSPVSCHLNYIQIQWGPSVIFLQVQLFGCGSLGTDAELCRLWIKKTSYLHPTQLLTHRNTHSTHIHKIRRYDQNRHIQRGVWIGVTEQPTTRSHSKSTGHMCANLAPWISSPSLFASPSGEPTESSCLLIRNYPCLQLRNFLTHRSLMTQKLLFIFKCLCLRWHNSLKHFVRCLMYQMISQLS